MPLAVLIGKWNQYGDRSRLETIAEVWLSTDVAASKTILSLHVLELDHKQMLVSHYLWCSCYTLIVPARCRNI